MREFRQEPKRLKRAATAAWCIVFASAVATLMGPPEATALGLLSTALGVGLAVVVHERIDAAPAYLVLDEDGIRLTRLNATIPWSAVRDAGLVPASGRKGAIARNRLAVELDDADLAETLRRAPKLKSLVRQSVLRRRRLEIVLPALDAPYDEFGRAMALSLALAQTR
ncbi:MAG: hypothetical protein JNJ73_01675 [Hyphomonadaceae bacterium]|nr:hypothetical protein [Hyphomonadaceae bacterium]